MTEIENLTEKLDELYDAFESLEDTDIDHDEIQEIVAEIETYSSDVAERVRSLEKLNQKYEEVIPQMQRELESYPEPEPDDIETEYFTGIVLELGEEYERSSDRIETLREDHNETMSDENVFDILHN